MTTENLSCQPYLLAIDPSLANLGVALLDGMGHLVEVVQVTHHMDTHVPWEFRAAHMSLFLGYFIPSILEGRRVAVIIEVPSNWFSEKGQGSKDKGDVQKLYFFTGALATALAVCPLVHSVWGVHPEQWKGQTPKKVVMQRLAKRCEREGFEEIIHNDAAEAAMLGVYSHERREPDNEMSEVRFSQPITLIAKGAGFTRIGEEGREVRPVLYYSEFSLTHYTGRGE